MKVLVNGSALEIKDGSTVREAIEAIGVSDSRGVAVAVDEEIVQSRRWDDVILSEGQRLEVLRAVQGGAG